MNSDNHDTRDKRGQEEVKEEEEEILLTALYWEIKGQKEGQEPDLDINHPLI